MSGMIWDPPAGSTDTDDWNCSQEPLQTIWDVKWNCSGDQARKDEEGRFRWQLSSMASELIGEGGNVPYNMQEIAPNANT